MHYLVKTGRWFFAIGIAGLAGQQFYYGAFRPLLVPPYFSPFGGESILTYLVSLALVVAAIAIVTGKKAKIASVLLGFLFLALFLFCHVRYECWIDPNSKHIGVWGNALKESAMAGSAFVVAGSFFNRQPAGKGEKALIPVGSILFSITMIVFGIEHFLYPDFVKTLVPGWIPFNLFWTYFAAVALIGSGLCIVLRIRVKLVATLLGIMIFLWVLVLHIPRAVVAPASDYGNELTSVFEALAFSGIAFLIGELL